MYTCFPCRKMAAHTIPDTLSHTNHTTFRETPILSVSQGDLNLFSSEVSELVGLLETSVGSDQANTTAMVGIVLSSSTVSRWF